MCGFFRKSLHFSYLPPQLFRKFFVPPPIKKIIRKVFCTMKAYSTSRDKVIAELKKDSNAKSTELDVLKKLSRTTINRCHRTELQKKSLSHFSRRI